MTTLDTPAGMLSVAEVAPLLGLSVPTIRKMVRDRRLTYFKVGRRVVFDRQDIERHLRGCRVEAKPLPMLTGTL